MWFCPDDPLTEYIRNKYHAQLLAVPTTGVRPGLILEAPDSIKPFGDLKDLFGKDLDITTVLDHEENADIASKRSRNVSVDISLNILEGILSAFGIPAPAGVKASISRSGSIVYSFQKGSV